MMNKQLEQQNIVKKLWIILGAFNALLAILLGTFGAHGLKQSISPEMLTVYQTAVQYQMSHALALLMIGAVAHFWSTSSWLKAAGWLLTTGIVLFSGSLYLLSITGIKNFGWITPVGGICFILGWMALILATWKADGLSN
ncbi:DUF423 domain-containing protein [Candidatus Venteria ishoeyi]|uniref:DUF423 domain-containing protein n=1 Tax=Candidatus Venteria ishoeyi TaxID=1899563 RepID=A0A1H6FE85_9GAMM|nr:DUF423 domain-containing protein [Candidatus Venteria ishoeyi]MDM8545751.1 DUF423 domain-containing protein [Candidatus Venteria ishoeyi]SEH07649.1 Uncharacterised protein [Candidatus Venteria ishoeyi]